MHPRRDMLPTGIRDDEDWGDYMVRPGNGPACKRAVVFLAVTLALAWAGPLSAGTALEGGIDAYHAGRHEQAVAIFRPLAEAGDPEAQLFMGFLAARGHGLPADPALAAYWYTRAAEAGVPEAQYELGLMYELGRGVAADVWEAERWYGLATGQGYCPGELEAGGRLGDR